MTVKVSTPNAITPIAIRTRCALNRWAIATRSRTEANRTVSRAYLSAVSFAAVPSS